jgi:magnesium-transporting ATPase (P-type)
VAGEALRVLAIARRSDATLEIAEREMTFLGLVGVIDPPRPEAKRAVRTCVEAGIKPVMITGDHPVTGQAVARELGMLTTGGAITVPSSRRWTTPSWIARSRTSRSTPPPGVDGGDDLFGVDALPVDRGRAELGVAELALDDVERHAFAGEFDGAGVAQRVQSEAAPNPPLARRPCGTTRSRSSAVTA